MKKLVWITALFLVVGCGDDNNSVPSSLSDAGENNAQGTENGGETAESLRTIKQGEGDRCLQFDYSTIRCESDQQALAESSKEPKKEEAPIQLENSEEMQNQKYTLTEASQNGFDTSTLENQLNTTEDQSIDATLFKYVSKDTERTMNFLSFLSNGEIDASGEVQNFSMDMNGSSVPVSYSVDCNGDSTSFHLVTGNYGIRMTYTMNESGQFESERTLTTDDGSDVETQNAYCEVDPAANQDGEEQAGDLAEDAEQAAEETAEDAEQAAEETAEDAEQTAEDAQDAVEETAEDAEQAAEETAEDVEQAAEETAQDAEEAVENAAQEGEQAVEEGAESLEEAADNVAEETGEAAQAVGEAADQAVDEAGEAIQNGAEAVEEGAENVVEGAQDLAEDAGEAVNNAAEETGEAIENGVENTEEALEDTGAVVSEAAESTVDEAGDVAQEIGESAEQVAEETEQAADENFGNDEEPEADVEVENQEEDNRNNFEKAVDWVQGLFN